MTREEAISMLKSKLDGHTDTSYEWCECVRMAIKALEQCEVWNGNQMKFPNTFDEFAKDYGFIDKEEVYTNGSNLIPVFRVKQWLAHIEQEPKTDKALNLLAEWAVECGFGYDNIPEEYEKYKDYIADMGYAEGLAYIAQMESEVSK